MSDELDVPQLLQTDGSPSVIAYRMGQLEVAVGKLHTKLDDFPTLSTITLMLDPIRDSIRTIEAERQVESNLKTQLRVALTAAILSPIVSGIISLFIIVGVK